MPRFKKFTIKQIIPFTGSLYPVYEDESKEAFTKFHAYKQEKVICLAIIVERDNYENYEFVSGLILGEYGIEIPEECSNFYKYVSDLTEVDEMNSEK